MSPSLARFVDRIDIVRPIAGQTERRVSLLPDGGASLVFRLLGDGSGDLGVRGPNMRAYRKIAPTIPLFVRVVFRPGGAYPFFGVSLEALRDRLALLDEVWGDDAARLCDRLVAIGSRDPSATTSAIEDALVTRMKHAPFEPASAMAARAAVPLLASGDRSIDEVATTLGVSARHLRRAFQACVGVTPKSFARIARFQRAVALGRVRPGSWNEVARAAGYFDQAHLTWDFSELARTSPGALARGEEPPVGARC